MAERPEPPSGDSDRQLESAETSGQEAHSVESARAGQTNSESNSASLLSTIPWVYPYDGYTCERAEGDSSPLRNCGEPMVTGRDCCGFSSPPNQTGEPPYPSSFYDIDYDGEGVNRSGSATPPTADDLASWVGLEMELHPDTEDDDAGRLEPPAWSWAVTFDPLRADENTPHLITVPTAGTAGAWTTFSQEPVMLTEIDWDAPYTADVTEWGFDAGPCARIPVDGWSEECLRIHWDGTPTVHRRWHTLPSDVWRVILHFVDRVLEPRRVCSAWWAWFTFGPMLRLTSHNCVSRVGSTLVRLPIPGKHTYALSDAIDSVYPSEMRQTFGPYALAHLGFDDIEVCDCGLSQKYDVDKWRPRLHFCPSTDFVPWYVLRVLFTSTPLQVFHRCHVDADDVCMCLPFRNFTGLARSSLSRKLADAWPQSVPEHHYHGVVGFCDHPCTHHTDTTTRRLCHPPQRRPTYFQLGDPAVVTSDDPWIQTLYHRRLRRWTLRVVAKAMWWIARLIRRSISSGALLNPGPPKRKSRSERRKGKMRHGPVPPVTHPPTPATPGAVSAVDGTVTRPSNRYFALVQARDRGWVCEVTAPCDPKGIPPRKVKHVVIASLCDRKYYSTLKLGDPLIITPRRLTRDDTIALCSAEPLPDATSEKEQQDFDALTSLKIPRGGEGLPSIPRKRKHCPSCTPPSSPDPSDDGGNSDPGHDVPDTHTPTRILCEQILTQEQKARSAFEKDAMLYMAMLVPREQAIKESSIVRDSMLQAQSEQLQKELTQYVTQHLAHGGDIDDLAFWLKVEVIREDPPDDGDPLVGRLVDLPWISAALKVSATIKKIAIDQSAHMRRSLAIKRRLPPTISQCHDVAIQDARATKASELHRALVEFAVGAVATWQKHVNFAKYASEARARAYQRFHSDLASMGESTDSDDEVSEVATEDLHPAATDDLGNTPSAREPTHDGTIDTQERNRAQMRKQGDTCQCAYCNPYTDTKAQERTQEMLEKQFTAILKQHLEPKALAEFRKQVLHVVAVCVDSGRFADVPNVPCGAIQVFPPPPVVAPAPIPLATSAAHAWTDPANPNIYSGYQKWDETSGRCAAYVRLLWLDYVAQTTGVVSKTWFDPYVNRLHNIMDAMVDETGYLPASVIINNGANTRTWSVVSGAQKDKEVYTGHIEQPAVNKNAAVGTLDAHLHVTYNPVTHVGHVALWLPHSYTPGQLWTNYYGGFYRSVTDLVSNFWSPGGHTSTTAAESFQPGHGPMRVGRRLTPYPVEACLVYRKPTIDLDWPGVLKGSMFLTTILGHRWEVVSMHSSQHLAACVEQRIMGGTQHVPRVWPGALTSLHASLRVSETCGCVCRRDALQFNNITIDNGGLRVGVPNASLRALIARTAPCFNAEEVTDPLTIGASQVAASRAEAAQLLEASERATIVQAKFAEVKSLRRVAAALKDPCLAQKVVLGRPGGPPPTMTGVGDTLLNGSHKRAQCDFCGAAAPFRADPDNQLCNTCLFAGPCAVCNSPLYGNVGCSQHGRTRGSLHRDPPSDVKRFVNDYLDCAPLFACDGWAYGSVQVPQFELPAVVGVGRAPVPLKAGARVVHDPTAVFAPTRGARLRGIGVSPCIPIVYAKSHDGYANTLTQRCVVEKKLTCTPLARQHYTLAAKVISKRLFRRASVTIPTPGTPHFRRLLLEAFKESDYTPAQRADYLRALDEAYAGESLTIPTAGQRTKTRGKGFIKGEKKQGLEKSQDLDRYPADADECPPPTATAWDVPGVCKSQEPGRIHRISHLSTGRAIQPFQDLVVGAAMIVTAHALTKWLKKTFSCTLNCPDRASNVTSVLYAGGRNAEDTANALKHWAMVNDYKKFCEADFSKFDSNQVLEMLFTEVALRQIVHPAAFHDPIIGSVLQSMYGGTTGRYKCTVYAKDLVKAFTVYVDEIMRTSGDYFTTFANTINCVLFNIASYCLAMCDKEGWAINASNIERAWIVGGFGIAAAGDDHLRAFVDEAIIPWFDRRMASLNMKAPFCRLKCFEHFHELGMLAGSTLSVLVQKITMHAGVRHILSYASSVNVPNFARWLYGMAWSLDTDLPLEVWIQSNIDCFAPLLWNIRPYSIILRHLQRLVNHRRLATNQRRVPNIDRATQRRLYDPEAAYKPYKFFDGGCVFPIAETDQQLADQLAERDLNKFNAACEQLDQELAQINELPCLIRTKATDLFIACATGRASVDCTH